MSHTTKKLKASELIEDFSIYPRNGVFDGHVHDLAEALRAGAALPPVVADSKSKRLTDGFHRVRSHVRVFGPEAVIEVLRAGFGADRVETLRVGRGSAGDSPTMTVARRQLGADPSNRALPSSTAATDLHKSR